MADGGQTELSFILTLETGGMETVVDSLEAQFTQIENSVNNIVTALAATQMPEFSNESIAAMQELIESISNVEMPEISSPTGAFPPDEIDGASDSIAGMSAKMEVLEATVAKYADILLPYWSRQKEIDKYTAKEQQTILRLTKQMHGLTNERIRATELTDAAKDGLISLKGEMIEQEEVSKKSTKAQEKFNMSLGFLDDEASEAGTIISALTGKMTVLAAAATILTGIINALAKEMREYAKANYESVGSTQALMMQTRALQGGLAGTQEQSMKAVQALAMTGVHLDEGSDKFQKYTGRIMMLAYAYGISEQASANFLARFDAMGVAADDAVASLDYVAKAVSFAGISSEEATMMVERLNKAAYEAHAMYGSAEAAQEFARGMATMGAAARKAQVPLDLVLDATEKLMKGGPEMIMALGGAAFNTTPMEKLEAGFEKIPELMERMHGIAPEFREDMVKALTGYDSMAQLESMNKLGQEIGFTSEALQKYQADIDAQKEVEENYREAMETLSGTMKEALMPVLSALTQVLQPLAEAFVFLMKPVIVLGQMLGKLMQTDVGRWIVYITGAIVGLTVAVKMFGLTFAKIGIGILIYGIAAALEWLMSNDLPEWLNVVIGLVGALGVAFVVLKVKALAAGGAVGGGLIKRLQSLFSVVNKAKMPGGKGFGLAKGFESFMKGIKKGLLVFAKNSGKILKGAFTFMAAMIMLVAPIALLAWVTKELGVSATDMGLYALILFGAMLLFSLAMKIMAAAATAIMPVMPAVWLFIAALVVLAGVLWLVSKAAENFAKAVATIINAMGDFFVKLAGSMMEFGLGVQELGKGLLIVAAAGIALLAGTPGLFAAALGLGALMLAMLLFPTTDFTNMANAMMIFSTAVQGLKGVGDIFDKLEDILDNVDEMEDANLSALFNLARALFWMSLIPPNGLKEVSNSIRDIGDAVGSIGDVPDLTTMLAQNIIDGSEKFAQAATILDDYTADIAEYLERIDGFDSAIAPTLKFEEDLANVMEPGAKASPVAGAATLESTRISSSEARNKMIKLLEEQNKLLAKLDKDPENKNLEDKLSAIVARLDELIMRSRGGPGVGEASVWQ